MASSHPEPSERPDRAEESGEHVPRAPESIRGDGDLRPRILEAATRLFATKGFAATSMRDIAEAVACTKPALYYHFGGKGALFREIIEREHERIRANLLASLETPSSVRERLIRGLRSHFDYVRSHRYELKLLMRSELHPDAGQPEIDVQSMREYYDRLALRVLREGVAEGELRDDVDLQDVLHLIAGAVDLRTAMCVLHAVPIPEDYPERIIALLFGGIGA